MTTRSRTSTIDPEARARKKISQLTMQLAKDKIDWHSMAHLSRDLFAVSIAEYERTRK